MDARRIRSGEWNREGFVDLTYDTFDLRLGKQFEGHRAPFAEWYTETTMQAAEIVVKSGVPLGDENHCYRCDGNSLLHDAVRRMLNNADVDKFSGV